MNKAIKGFALIGIIATIIAIAALGFGLEIDAAKIELPSISFG